MTTDLSRRGLFRALRVEQLSARTESDAIEMRHIARIGEACVEPKGVMCRRCGDECDVRAISFRLLGAGKALAVLDGEACTGCRACLPVCPVQAIDLIPVERAALIAGLVEISRAS